MEAYSVDLDAIINRQRDTAYKWEEISIGRPGSLQHPPPRLGFTLCEKDGFVYLFGGSDHDAKNDLWCLNLAKKDWHCIQPHTPAEQCEDRNVPPPRHGHSIVIPTSGLYQGQLILFGGKGESGPFADIWAYNLDTQVWTQLPLPLDEAKASPKAYHSAVLWKREGHEDLLIFGGEGEYGATTEMWALTFPEVDIKKEIEDAEAQLKAAQEAGDADATAAAEAAIVKAKGEEPAPEPEKPIEEMDYDEQRAWGLKLEALQREKDDRMYKACGHWQKVVPKMPENGPPPVSQHYAIMYTVKARQPHHPHEGQVMLAFGGFTENYLMNDVWELDMPHQKVPTWRRHHASGAIPSMGNLFGASSIDHYEGKCSYAPGADPPLMWEAGQNILALLGKMGPSDGAKLALANYDLSRREWTKIRLVGGPSQGFVPQMILQSDKSRFVTVGGNEEVGFPLQIHLREELQQLQRNTQYPGFFGATQAGGMFKLSVPTELEQRERSKGRHRMMTCAQPSDRDARILAKAKKKVEDDRMLRKAEFRRTMNPPTRPEVIDSCPPLSIRRLESMPQYFSTSGSFIP